MQINKGKRERTRRIMLYGQHGVGKSTWAAQAGALILNLEDGLDDIECDSSEMIKTFPQFQEAVAWIHETKPEYPAIAIDSVDWLEKVIEQQVLAEQHKQSMDDFDYGKGPGFVIDKWRQVLMYLDLIRQQGKHIILLAHADVSKFNDPESDSYDRYTPRLRRQSSPILQEWCDEVLFASFRRFTKQEDQGFGNTRTIAIGGEDRYIRTTEGAAIMAKNRLGLPAELDMAWNAYAQHLGNGAGNIEGIVKDGSSKGGKNEIRRI